MQLAKSGPATPEAIEPIVTTAAEADTELAARDAGLVNNGGAPTGEELGAEHGNLRLPVHVNARGLTLGVIATVAFIFGLQWAKNFLVPLLLGIFIAYTLSPVVRWLERWHIRRAIGATLVTGLILVGMVLTAHRVQGEFLNIVDELPTLTHKVTRMLMDASDGPSTIQQVQAAAAELEQAAANAGAAKRDRKSVV